MLLQYHEILVKLVYLMTPVKNLYGSLKHLAAGLNVELKNWHSAVADATALSGVLQKLSQIMTRYEKFEQRFEMQRKRASDIGYRRSQESKKKRKVNLWRSRLRSRHFKNAMGRSGNSFNPQRSFYTETLPHFAWKSDLPKRDSRKCLGTSRGT